MALFKLTALISIGILNMPKDLGASYFMEYIPELWLPVKGFEPRFRISNFGRVISINGRWIGDKILSPHLDSLGYFVTSLRMKPLNRKVRIHTLVAEHFVEKKSTLDIFVNHLDGNKLNNFYLNLD